MRLIGAASTVFAFVFMLVLSGANRQVGANPHDGREIFRYDTFGDEQLWTDVLRMHEVVQNVSPDTALNTLGLKVDVQALPRSVTKALEDGLVDLTDPAVTRQLLTLNAVVGVVATVSNDQITSLGITCALCHSTVDNSFITGIGRRLDGWPNLDLNPGLILSLSPTDQLDAATKLEFANWGPGKYDARHHAFTGTGFVLLNGTTPSVPSVIPPAYGLQGVGFETFTGDGPISYWNAYVAIGQMGGHGDFIDPRINLTIDQPPPDRVTPKLQALLAYQLQLRAPAPPKDSFDKFAARRGEQVFHDVGCATCHVPPTYTDVLLGSPPPLLHPPTGPLSVGTDPIYAQRSATKMYRTTPLRALWQHPPYFHDGSAADLAAVVSHYESVLPLTLTAQQRADLIEFLKSL